MVGEKAHLGTKQLVAMLNSEEIKPIALVVIELRLSKCISKGVIE